MRDSVLYFPHIEIANTEWLKSALLLWDHVYRIVPKGYSPQDGGEMAQAVDSGLVRSITLEDADIQGFATDFIEFVQSLSFIPAGLDQHQTARLHPEKVDSHLYPFLEQYAVGQSDHGFIQLPRWIVRGYMFFLANQVARRRNLARCTDDEYSFSISAYFSEEANFSEWVYNPEADGFYSSLIMKDVLPSSVAAIPMDKIIEAARNSKDEKVQFRNEVMKFSQELHRCESKDHAQTIMNDFTRDLLDAKQRLRSSHGLMSRDDVGSLVVVGVPTALTAYGALVSAKADPYGVHTIASSLLIGAIAAYANYGRARSTTDNPSGAAYLISLDERFAGAKLLPRFDRYIEEFIND